MLEVIRNYNTDDIIGGMKYLLDKASKSEEVRQHAINITSEHQDKIGAVFDWIKQNVSYVPDPLGAKGEDIELFTSPVRMVRDYNQGKALAGDCDDMAILATALYRAIGIRANVVIIDSAGSGLDHAYCRVWSDKLNQYMNCDPSSDYPLGWEIQYKERIVVE